VSGLEIEVPVSRDQMRGDAVDAVEDDVEGGDRDERESSLSESCTAGIRVSEVDAEMLLEGIANDEQEGEEIPSSFPDSSSRDIVPVRRRKNEPGQSRRDPLFDRIKHDTIVERRVEDEEVQDEEGDCG